MATQIRSTRTRCRRAFTLVEAIATIVVLAALGSIGSFILVGAVDGYSRAATDAQLHSELSIALDRIDRELRFIPKNAGGTGPRISAITANSIAFNDDYSLSLSGSNLMFVDDGSPARILLQDVTSFSVQAFNESNAPMAASLSGAACDPVRRLQITITLQRNGVSHTMRCKTFIRSMAEGT